MRRARFTVAYDGSVFHGFAANHGVRTVVGDLTAALSRTTRIDVALTGAGRTDAGVHGWGQVVSCDLPAGIDLAAVVRSINKLCAPEIALRDPAWVADDFSARFSARWRQYRYHVWNGSSPNPLVADRAWFVPAPLDVDAMQAGVEPLLGEHDFSSFCRRPKVANGEPEPSMTRRLVSGRWSAVDTFDPDEGAAAAGRLLRFEIRGTAFCHQMVRSIVGTLVDVGRGKFGPADIAPMLAARDRRAAGTVAPPGGLTLWHVGY